MSYIQKNSNNKLTKKEQKMFAPTCRNMVEFRCYTKQVWSKLAGRSLTENEVDQIIESFGMFLEAVTDTEINNEHN